MNNILHVPKGSDIKMVGNIKRGNKSLHTMLLIAIYYVVAIVVLTLHFTGHLERWNLEWLVFVLALTVFPAVLYL